MNITPIVEATITLLCTIIVYFLVPVLKARIGVAQFEQAKRWVGVAVKAAEQIYRDHPGMGAEKKAMVIKFLEDKGLHVDEKSLDTMIEAAVQNYFGDDF